LQQKMMKRKFGGQIVQLIHSWTHGVSCDFATPSCGLVEGQGGLVHSSGPACTLHLPNNSWRETPHPDFTGGKPRNREVKKLAQDITAHYQ
jgi:hypothetical protein